MKRLYHFWLAAAFIISVLALPGCSKFLDVNDNPNATETANLDLVLPSAQAAIVQAYGLQYTINGGMWMQYWTQNPYANQYKAIDSYNMEPANFDRQWSLLYATAASDLTTLTDGAGAAKNAQFSGVAYLLKAYTFQLLTDAFGDIPLSDALRGATVLNPKYDPQQQVYDSVFTWIKKGLSLLDPNSAYPIESGDLIYGGDVDSWIGFGNTMWLRAAMRICRVDEAKAKSEISALFATNPTFIQDDAQMEFQNVGGARSPIYAEAVALQVINIRSSATAIDRLKANNDPRIAKYYSQISAGGYVGLLQGDYNSQPTPGTYSSVSLNCIGPVAPVRLLSVAESFFLRSEARARGYSTESDAQSLYNEGVRASFTTQGLTTAAADTYLAQSSADAPDVAWPGDMATQIKRIITQKYFAFCGNETFEAWCDWRRTGYPDFLIRSVNSAFPGDTKPTRFLYPNVEITRNGNFPGAKLLTDKVWWDID